MIISVLSGIWNNTLIEPVIYQRTLRGNMYQDIILNTAVKVFIENLVKLKDYTFGFNTTVLQYTTSKWRKISLIQISEIAELVYTDPENDHHYHRIPPH